jgi:hypothetical protein
MKRSSKFYVLLTLLVNCSLLWAASPQEEGLKLAKELEAANIGFKGDTSIMKMTLIDAHGTKTVREMEGKVLEVDGDGDKSLINFLNPKDVKGTKMLTWSHKNGDDDQWLYLPSLKRVKRISSSGKASSFMGSEFSYEDLGSQEIEKFKFELLKSDDKELKKLARFPKDEADSGYSKQVLFISPKYMSAVKAEYYDRKKELLKVASFDGFKAYNVGGKTMYRASSIHMKNVQTKKESIITWENREIGKKLKDSDFESKNLE